MHNRQKIYVGLDKEIRGGMTTIGRAIRDARVFGLIDDSETCEGWNYAGIDDLIDKVNQEWDKHGCLVSQMPADLQERHQRIHGDAIKKAKASGWSGADELRDDDE